ncbi:hypothetical protein AX15_000180 [Amanita polypyramis BW_CC]|nr:hypothetical protein AX15_000180 [Amanita polypyramis BW_CC]
MSLIIDDDDGPYLDGDPSDIIPDDDLPFIRYKLPHEEEDLESIRTVEVWVVDIPDSRRIVDMLKWIKQNDLETPELDHLKRIRKQDDRTTLLLTIATTPPPLPDFIDKLPYLLAVPSSSALTLPSLALKSAVWPTFYTPRRKGEEDAWSRAKVRWAWKAMKAAVDVAIQAKEKGDLPIAACVPAPHGDTLGSLTFMAHDTRTSSKHPLRHAAVNLIRQVADYHPLQSGRTTDERRDNAQNGTNYLLTSLTVFLTHEPCIMCSMALLHSRVKDVIYLLPMPETGGCGGLTCLPTLKGVNHRFKIGSWKISEAPLILGAEGLCIDSIMDA